MGSYTSVPAELRALRSWCVWKYEARSGQKSTKVPYNPITGFPCSVTNPAGWSSFDEVLAYSHCYDGIGFILSKNDPYVFIDLDMTDDPEEMKFQTQIFETIKTYAEISPSGKGLHLICKGSIPSGIRHASVEMYGDRRYMAMTGDVFRDCPIVEVNGELDSLWAEVNRRKGADHPSIIVDRKSIDFDEVASTDDSIVFEKASSAANGDLFQRLWNGDFHTDYNGDQSRADFALIDLISFFSGNAAQVKRMFRASKLGQRKKASRDDYVDKMIERSFDNHDLGELDFSAIKRQVEAMKAVDGNRDLLINSEKGSPTFEESLSLERAAIPRSIDDGVFTLPDGLVGQIAKYIYDAAYKPVPEIAITGALGLMAGICGRAYNCEGTGLNLYLLAVAETGRGKEAINSGISKLIVHTLALAPTLSDFIGPERFSSGQAVLRTLGNHPTKSMICNFTEFGLQLKAVSTSRASHDQQFLRVLLSLHNKSGQKGILLAGHMADVNLNVPPIQSPAFSFVGDATPSTFYESITEGLLESGLMSRLLVVEYLGKRVPTNYLQKTAVPPPSLITGLSDIVSAAQASLLGKDRIPVVLSSEADSMRKNLDIKVDDYINDDDNKKTSELFNRAVLNTTRIAALLAVGKNPYLPIVDGATWRWAEQFVWHCMSKVESRFKSGLVGLVSNEQNQLTSVKEILSKYLATKQKDVPEHWRALRVVSLRWIQRKLRGIRAFSEDRFGATLAIRRAISIMLETGELIEVPKPQAQKEFGTSGKIYLIAR